MTYIPKYFQVSDDQTLQEFMRMYNFATIVSNSPEGFVTSHIPIITRSVGKTIVLVGHMAQANHHWKLMNGAIPALFIFHGPHGYISPTWCESALEVPTWNYGVVHAHGLPIVNTDEAFIRSVLKDLVTCHEGDSPKSWRLDMLPAKYSEQMLHAIVGFEMAVIKLEGKFKLGQNQSVEDRRRIITALKKDISPDAKRLAEFMRLYSDPVT